MRTSEPPSYPWAAKLLFCGIGAWLALFQFAVITFAEEPSKAALPPDSTFSPSQLMLQRDGTLLAAGSLGHYEGTGSHPGSRSAFAVARYKPDGTLDATFGEAGFAVLDANGGAACLASDREGHIVVGGYADRNAAVGVLTAKGQLDTTFGKDGLVAPDVRAAQSGEALRAEEKLRSLGGLSFGNGSSSVNAVAVLPSGEILAGALVNPYELVVYSFLKDGSPNKAFGDQGFVRTAFKSSAGSVISASPESLRPLGGGRFLLGGAGVVQKMSKQVTNALVLAKYLADGQLDSDFGDGGKVIRESKSASAKLDSIVPLPDGKVLVAGNFDDRFVLFRYLRDGKVDVSFGDNGAVILDAPYSALNGATDRIQYVGEQGKNLLVVGFFGELGAAKGSCFAFRLSANGALDKTFATDGKLTYKLTGLIHSAQAAVDDGGNIVVASAAIKSHNLNVVRFNKNGGLDSNVRAGDQDALKKVIEQHYLRNGRGINAQDEQGELPLTYAATRARSKELVEQMIAMGADVNRKNKHGQTVLMNVVGDSQRKEIVELLLVKGADVTVKNPFGQTALVFAIQRDALENARLLIFSGAEVDVRDNEGGTPLMGVHSKEGAKMLLANGAKVDATDTRHRTALMRQASYGEKEIVETLLTAGADIHVQSDKGETAMSMAEVKGHAEVVRLLKDAERK